MSRVLISLPLCAAGTLSAGERHKWTDENGKIHFGDEVSAPKK